MNSYQINNYCSPKYPQPGRSSVGLGAGYDSPYGGGGALSGSGMYGVGGGGSGSGCGISAANAATCGYTLSNNDIYGGAGGGGGGSSLRSLSVYQSISPTTLRDGTKSSPSPGGSESVGDCDLSRSRSISRQASPPSGYHCNSSYLASPPPLSSAVSSQQSLHCRSVQMLPQQQQQQRQGKSTLNGGSDIGGGGGGEELRRLTVHRVSRWEEEGEEGRY